jgi:hypothetical protein
MALRPRNDSTQKIKILTSPDFERESWCDERPRRGNASSLVAVLAPNDAIHFRRFCLGDSLPVKIVTRNSILSNRTDSTRRPPRRLWSIRKTWTAALGAARAGSGGPVAPEVQPALTGATKMTSNEEDRAVGPRHLKPKLSSCRRGWRANPEPSRSLAEAMGAVRLSR